MIDRRINSGSKKYLICGSPVQYNRNKLIDVPEDQTYQLADLAYAQKDESFAAEREFRYCLIAFKSDPENADEAMFINIDESLDFAEPLWST